MTDNEFKIQFAIIIFVIFINITIGAWSVNEIVSWFGKDIPLFLDVIIGTIFGEVTMPIAIIGKIIGFF